MTDTSPPVPTAPVMPKRIGRYQVESELGRGAMGVVYRAEDPLLNRKVAIKTVLLSSDPEEREDFEARFFQEAKAAGGLNHPAIITIHDLGREGDLAFMAMELLEGVELREMMLTEHIPLATALDYATQMVQGIAYAHDRGVIHRDLKPANIMIIDGRLAKIMDFGIARLRTSQVKTQTGVLLGSPKYMAPEQIAGKMLDHRADLFSLGILLYEMVTGFAPFIASDITQLMYQVCHNPHRPPSEINRAVPPMLDLIIAKALAKDPNDRYADAHQFAADLIACRSLVETNPVEDLASRSMRQVIGPPPGATPDGDTQPLDLGTTAALVTGDATLVGAQRMPGSDRAPAFAISPQYDATAALARLADVSATTYKRAPDPARRHLAVALTCAALVALAIVFY